MKRHGMVLLFIGILLISGCYNARVTTGLAPSAQTVEVKWAHSFLGGLVPPSALSVAQECASGVASVETKLSFLNLVANVITFGIYSPMEITVTCASATAGIPVNAPYVTMEDGEELNQQTIAALMHTAIRLSGEKNTPVYLQLHM